MKCVKKLVAVLLTAVMALTLLTACGGGGGSTSGGDSMETVFNFTGEELTQLLNESLESDMVYDEYLGDRFAAAMNAAMDAGSQFADPDEAEAVVEGILDTAGFSDAEVAATVAPKGAEIRLVASGLESAIILSRDFLSRERKLAMQVQSLKEMETIIWSLRLFSKT